MAEGDRFEREFGAGWRAAYQLARNGAAPPAEVADKLMAALAKTLRKFGGVPGFEEMGEAIDNVVWRITLQSSGVGEEAAALIECFNALDRIVLDKGGHRNAKIAAGVAKSLVVRQGVHAKGDGLWPMRTQFAEAICTALVEHYYFARARPNLVFEGKVRHHEDARQWQQSVEEDMRPALGQIAERLSKDPSCKGLRAPNRTVKRQSTSDLLREGLVSNETPSHSLGVRGR